MEENDPKYEHYDYSEADLHGAPLTARGLEDRILAVCFQNCSTTIKAMTGAKAPLGMAFRYTLEEQVLSDAPPSVRHLERWDVSVRVDDLGDADHGRAIGDAAVIILNLEDGRDVRDLTDPAVGEWRDVAGLQGAPATGHLLVLDRVRVEPEYRGNGLGPVIAAAVIERLGRGCRLAACYPAPFEGACRPEDRRREIEALSRIWTKVGFRHWRDGVWMLDLERGA